MIEPVDFDLVLPKGNVCVDLIDDYSGRVIQREEGDNFLSPLVIKFAQFMQRIQWTMFHPNPVGGVSPQDSQPIFPADHIAYWNDATAENPTTETSVIHPIVGFATRHPVGAPIGARGNVNTTESLLTATEAKWVFDWITSQGNGTFQSVGWCRVCEEATAAMGSWLTSTGVSFSGHTNASNAYMFGLYWDGTNWFTCDSTTGGNPVRIVSFPAVGGITPTFVVNVPSTIATCSFALSAMGMTKIGTDWIIVGGNSTNPTVGRMNATGTQIWRRTETTVSSGPYYTDCTVDGSGNIWTVNPGNNTIYKLSSTDGTIISSFIVTGPHASARPVGITYDSADGNLWIYYCEETTTSRRVGVYKVTSAGVLVNAIGLPQTTATYVVQSPFSGSVYSMSTNDGRDLDTYAYYRHGTDAVSRAGSTAANLSVPGTSGIIISRQTQPLVMKGTELWVGRNGSPSQPCTYTARITGQSNLASRIRLASPVTKTSAQSLKITYTLTFS